MDEQLKVDFTPYGLTDGWVAHRWVVGLSGERPIWFVTLGHADETRESWSLVRTVAHDIGPEHSASRLTRTGPMGPAWELAFWLTQVTWPSGWPDELQSSYRARAMNFVDRCGRDPGLLSTTSWLVDGTNTPASTIELNGITASVATLHTGLDIMMLSHNAPAAEPRLGEVSIDSYSNGRHPG